MIAARARGKRDDRHGAHFERVVNHSGYLGRVSARHCSQPRPLGCQKAPGSRPQGDTAAVPSPLGSRVDTCTLHIRLNPGDGGRASGWGLRADHSSARLRGRRLWRFGGVALGSQCVVDGCLRQIDAAFGITDHLSGLECGLGDQQGCRSAFPISSLAWIMMRRAMNLGSSPASIMRASQYTAASGSLPRIDLINAEMMS